MILPVFTSNHSVGDSKSGSSILTLEPAKDKIVETEPISIFTIAKVHDLSRIFLLEKRFSGFYEANKIANKMEIPLVYGIKFHICNEIKDKTDESWAKTSKINVFAKNGKGLKELMKLYSVAFTEGFFDGTGRIDWGLLNKVSEDLIISVPFYDSFLFNNLLYSKACVPDFGKKIPYFFVEDNDLPFDSLVRESICEYIKSVLPAAKTLETRTILYYSKADVLAYQTFRCFEKRSNLEEPRLEHFSSDKFSFESWLEDNK